MQFRILIPTIVLFVLCLKGCLPEGNDTYIIALFPAEFKKEWHIAMRCSEKETDAAVLQLKIDDPLVFEAEGRGVDYDSSLMRIRFKGIYDVVTDSLFCVITTLDPEIDYTIRKDSFALRFDKYKGEYVSAVNTFFATGMTGCDASFRFIFDDAPKSALSCNFEQNKLFWSTE